MNPNTQENAETQAPQTDGALSEEALDEVSGGVVATPDGGVATPPSGPMFRRKW